MSPSHKKQTHCPEEMRLSIAAQPAPTFVPEFLILISLLHHPMPTSPSRPCGPCPFTLPMSKAPKKSAFSMVSGRRPESGRGPKVHLERSVGHKLTGAAGAESCGVTLAHK